MLGRNPKEPTVPRERLFDYVFGRASEGMLLITLEGMIERANPAVSTILGYSLNELEDRSVLELIHVTDRNKQQPEVQAVLDKRQDSIRMDIAMVSKRNRMIHCKYRSFPIHHGGEIVLFLTLLLPDDPVPDTLIESVSDRLHQLEVLIQRYDGDNKGAVMVNIGDHVGGDLTGRDKTTNSTRVFYFVGAIFIAICSLLAYIAYVVTFPLHNGDVVPPAPVQMEHSHVE